MEGKQIPEVRKHNVLHMRYLLLMVVMVGMKLVFGSKVNVIHIYNDQGIT